MPAHVAIYKDYYKNWKRSIYLKKCGNLEWNVSLHWINTPTIQHDFAWTKLNNDGTNNYLEETKFTLTDPVDVNFYFNQLYDINGKCSDYTSWGKIKGVVYPSPNSLLLESIGIGFKGMSGAVCTDENNNLVGMFIRRCGDLGKSNNYVPSDHNISSMCRGIIMPSSEMIKHISVGGIPVTSICT